MTDTNEMIEAVYERPDGEPALAPGWRSGAHWTVPVVYTLADGSEVESNHTGLTKTEAQELRACLPRRVSTQFYRTDVEFTRRGMLG